MQQPRSQRSLARHATRLAQQDPGPQPSTEMTTTTTTTRACLVKTTRISSSASPTTLVLPSRATICFKAARSQVVVSAFKSYTLNIELLG
jgi:hypothetical protein